MVRKIDIVLAAPGDADSARMVVEAVVDHMNLGAAQKAGARLDLTLLDDGGLPASIPDGLAIFVGVLWTTFAKGGLDDARAARVRFLAAYDKFRADPNTVRMLLFVNDEAIAPSKIDPEALALVRDFQERLKADGLRAYVYDGREDLRTLLEAKLERVVMDLPAAGEPVPTATPEPAPVEPVAPETPISPADVINIDSRPKKPQIDEPASGQQLTPPKLAPAANDDRFVLTALAPLTPELLDEVDRKAWTMIQSFEMIVDIIAFMAGDARHYIEAHKHEKDAEPDPQMGLIFTMMTRKEEDELAAFTDTAEQKIGMLKEIYQTVLNAMRHEYYRRKPDLEVSDFDDEVLDETFRAVAKFSGPLRAAAPHLQAFRSKVSGLKRTTAEFHKAKQQSLEFLDRFLADLAALRSLLARQTPAEASSRS
jgi:hypothetical protein